MVDGGGSSATSSRGRQKGSRRGWTVDRRTRAAAPWRVVMGLGRQQMLPGRAAATTTTFACAAPRHHPTLLAPPAASCSAGLPNVVKHAAAQMTTKAGLLFSPRLLAALPAACTASEVTVCCVTSAPGGLGTL